VPGGPLTAVEMDAQGRYAYLATAQTAHLVSIVRDEHSSAEVAARVEATVPFALDEGRVVPLRTASGARASRPVRARPSRGDCPAGTRPYGGRPPHDLVEWCAGPDDIVRGPWKLFWPNGQVMEEAVRDGDVVGTWTQRDDQGRVAETMEQMDGKRVRLTRFHDNGKPALTYELHWSTPVGPFRAWYPSGALREKGEFGDCDGRQCTVEAPPGLWTTYLEDGKIESQGMYLSRPEMAMQRLRRLPERIGRWTFVGKDGQTRSELYPCPPEFSSMWRNHDPQPVCK